MKNRLWKALLLVFFVLVIISLYLYWDRQVSKELSRSDVTEIHLNEEDHRYIREHQTINVYVEDCLLYLVRDDNRGYLPEYMKRLMEPVDLNINFTADPERADCELLVIDQEIRKNNNTNSYTMPLFQMDGALFLNEKHQDGQPLFGVAMADRLTDKELKEVSYRGENLKCNVEESAISAVKTAVKEDADFILGDRSSVIAALGEHHNFVALEDSVYTNNVCIIVPDDADTLYNILNQCINGLDRHQVTYELSQRWLNGNGPIYMRNTNKDYSVLTLIIFIAVFIAFYLYYQSSKNLYAELQDRMNKLQESKKELQTTFESVKHYMAELSMSGDILDVNRALYDFIDGEVYSRKIWDVLGLKEADRRRLESAVMGYNGKNKKESFEVEVKRNILVLDFFPIENTRGSVEKLLFMALDVTNERIAERQLRQDSKMIAVGQLAAGVAHEIRNPLGIIRNYCYVLKTMKDEDVQEKAIEHIEQAVNTSGNIINSLLNFSRISKSAGEVINLEEHINSLTSLNKNVLKKKNIHITIEAREEIISYVAVESLDMILLNLISNAADAIEGEGTITIRLWKERYFFFIEVADTGKGIEPEIIRDIYNPFFTTKEGSKGNGLGLYIVYNELNKMNGQIHVESTVGKGTTFRMILPLTEETPDAGNKTAQEQQ